MVRFQFLYHKLGSFDVQLPEGVQAFFLLNAVNFSEEYERLARATCGIMTYANMKQCMQKIFGDPSSCGTDGSPAVKSEPVFNAQHEVYQSVSNNSHGWHGHGKGNRG